MKPHLAIAPEFLIVLRCLEAAVIRQAQLCMPVWPQKKPRAPLQCHTAARDLREIPLPCSWPAVRASQTGPDNVEDVASPSAPQATQS